MIRKLHIIPVNSYFSIQNKRGSKKEGICLMLRWAPAISQRCVNLFNFSKLQWSAKGKDKEKTTKNA